MTESGITFAKAPSVGKLINLSGDLAKDHWLSIDVARQVQARATSVQVVLVAIGPTQLALASRETHGLAPRLIVQSTR